jgi:hypothetical protein
VWLRTLGFSPVTITVDHVLKFTARKPLPDAHDDGEPGDAPDIAES